MITCPKCSFKQSDNALECSKCGLIFSKYIARRTAEGESASPPPPLEKKPPIERDVQHDSWVARLLFEVKPKADSIDFTMRMVFFILFLLWGLVFIFSSVNGEPFGSGFWHVVNLPFHEAGHIFFRPFGRLIMSLGGTLGQLLMPVICMIVFLIKTRDTFAASFCLWWLGQNFMDIAPYIDDARRLTMPLLGGNTGQTSPYGFHDWEFILTETGLLRLDHSIARTSHGVGVCLMLLAIAWWAYLLFIYRRNLVES